MMHYWDECPDLARNPFNVPTRIDCDKEFVTEKVQYADGMKTSNRPDVCQDTMDSVESELNAGGYKSHIMVTADVLNLNFLTSPWV